jgi:DNA invertase Pin-like site-specific DNA recombinase
MKKRSVNSNLPLAFSYLRMSTTKQLRGDSLRRQKDASVLYAKENRLQLVESIEDIGVSAFRGANAKVGKLSLFLKAVELQQIPEGSTLIIESFDRLSRQSILKSMKIFMDIVSAGIHIVTLIDGNRFEAGSSDISQMIITLTLMSRAHEESDTKSKRLGEAWKNKRNNIQTKKLTKLCPGWLRLSSDRKAYETIARRVEIVRRLYNAALDGEGSYAIAKSLNSEGILPFGRSKIWVKSYVTKILSERAVLGEYQPHKMISGARVPEGEVILDYFPQVIDHATYYGVQAARKNRAQGAGGRRGFNVPNLFKNIAICDYCKAPMHYINKGKGPKGGTYLKCSSAVNGSHCSSVAWRYSHFETAFLFFCSEIDLQSIFVEADTKSEQAKAVSKILEVEGHLLDLENQREKNYRLYELLDNPAYIAGKINSVQSQIEEHETELKALKTAQLNMRVGTINAERFNEFVEAIRSTGEEKSERLRAVLHNDLRRLVTYLRVAPIGNSPSKKAVLTILEGMPKDPQEEEEFNRYITETTADDGRSNPTFKVGFSNSTDRIVVVDPLDPKKFLEIAEVESGKKSFSSLYSGTLFDMPDVVVRKDK